MFSDDGTLRTGIGGAFGAMTERVGDAQLAWLARSPEGADRAVAAEHPATPLTTLLRLAQDRSPAVRRGVARNRRAGVPPEVHQDLARDKSVDVIYALIANPTVADEVISRLARHRHREYAKAARRRLAAEHGELAGDAPMPRDEAAPMVPTRVPSLVPMREPVLVSEPASQTAAPGFIASGPSVPPLSAPKPSAPVLAAPGVPAPGYSAGPAKAPVEPRRMYAAPRSRVEALEILQGAGRR
ncbi:hypothetical protein [Demequina sp.]|uniref:hypothetical protein n=1 Tax=Demequina sp. TaxID=2050685 RepID=UPI0025FE47EA|nr:hypothetical protein [Demequina sp.]